MPRLKSLFAIALFQLLAIQQIIASGANAATIDGDLQSARPWTTSGTSPCNGLCDRDWALARMREFLPEEAFRQLETLSRYGAPSEYYVSSGDTILAMTYAKGGTAYLDPSLRVARFPDGTSYHSVGYLAVVNHDVGYRFVRIDLCGNWALIVDPSGGMSSSDEFLSGPGTRTLRILRSGNLRRHRWHRRRSGADIRWGHPAAAPGFRSGARASAGHNGRDTARDSDSSADFSDLDGRRGPVPRRRTVETRRRRLSEWTMISPRSPENRAGGVNGRYRGIRWSE